MATVKTSNVPSRQESHRASPLQKQAFDAQKVSHETFGENQLLGQTGDSTRQGFGVFEQIGGDLALIRPGMELSDQN